MDEIVAPVVQVETGPDVAPAVTEQELLNASAIAKQLLRKNEVLRLQAVMVLSRQFDLVARTELRRVLQKAKTSDLVEQILWESASMQAGNQRMSFDDLRHAVTQILLPFLVETPAMYAEEQKAVEKLERDEAAKHPVSVGCFSIPRGTLLAVAGLRAAVEVVFDRETAKRDGLRVIRFSHGKDAEAAQGYVKLPLKRWQKSAENPTAFRNFLVEDVFRSYAAALGGPPDLLIIDDLIALCPGLDVAGWQAHRADNANRLLKTAAKEFNFATLGAVPHYQEKIPENACPQLREHADYRILRCTGADTSEGDDPLRYFSTNEKDETQKWAIRQSELSRDSGLIWHQDQPRIIT